MRFVRQRTHCHTRLPLSKVNYRALFKLSTCPLRPPACTDVPPLTPWEQRTATSTYPSTAVRSSLFTHNPLPEFLCPVIKRSCISAQPQTVPLVYCRVCCWPCLCACCCWLCWCSFCGSITQGRMGGWGRGEETRMSFITRYGTRRPWWNALLFDFSKTFGTF